MTRELQTQAQTHMQQNEWEPAINYLEQAQAVEPENTYILGNLAFCYSRLARHEQAITLYEQLCTLQPDTARWHYMLGYQYYAQQQYAQAISHFDQALAIEPNYIVVLYRKGYALSTMEGKQGEALTILERCRKAYHALGEGEAKDRERKHYADACYQQGKLLSEVGNQRLAQERLREAATLKPDEADVHYALGKSYLEDKKFAEAIESLKTAQRLSKKPEHYILDRLAQAYVEAGQLAEAIQLYERMPPPIRNRPYILRHMGQLYIQLEQWDKAEPALRQAVKQENRNHNGHYYLALVYQQQQKWPEAAEAFRTAIKLRQKHYNVSFREAEEALAVLLVEHPEAESRSPARTKEQSPQSPSGRPVGRVKKFFPERGFGFLAVASSDKDLFFHIKQVEGRDTVEVGEYLEYTLSQGQKGPEATDLRIIPTGKSGDEKITG